MTAHTLGSSPMMVMSTARKDTNVLHRVLAKLNSAARKDVIMHLILDFPVGFGWMLESDSRTSGASWNSAKDVLSFQPVHPIRVWGALLLLLSVPFAVAAIGNYEKLYRFGHRALYVYWSFWAGISIIGLIEGRLTPWAPMMSFLWAIRTARLPEHPPWSGRN